MTRLNGGNKYHARRTYSALCGRTFDSRAEAEYGEYLWARQKNGEIHHLEYQVKYVLCSKPRCTLSVDFRYIVTGDEGTSYYVHEDVKGFETREFRAKRLWLREKGVDIKLIGGKHG